MPISERPEFSVIGGDAVRLVVVAPSDAVAGEEFPGECEGGGSLGQSCEYVSWERASQRFWRLR